MKHRYELLFYAFYDDTGMVRHLERMALRGWRLCRLGAFWQYEKIAPAPLKYAVAYSPEVTGFEPTTPEGQLRLEELSRAAGWQLAGRNGQLQIFYNEDPEADPFDTDPGLRLDVIHRTMKKNFLPTYTILALLAIMQVVMQLGNLRRGSSMLFSGATYFFSGLNWLSLAIWFVLLAVYLLELSRYLLWYRKALSRAEDGLLTPSPRSRWLQMLTLALLLGIVLSWMQASLRGQILVFLVILAGMFTVSMLSSKVMKRLNVSAGVNRVVTMGLTAILTVVLLGGILTTDVLRDQRQPAGTYEYNGRQWNYYREDIPLTLEDLGYALSPEDSIVSDTQSSPLVRRSIYRQDARWGLKERPDLTYYVAEVRFKPLWNLCLEDFLAEGEGYQTVEAAPWGADQAWKLKHEYRHLYVLSRDHTLVYLELEEDLTAEQKAIAGEKLFG